MKETRKRGRPRMYEEFVYFGMKITPQERQRIKMLAAREGKPASRAIIELINNALEVEQPRQLTACDLMKLLPAERRRILQEQAKKAAKFYRENPDLIMDGDDEIVEY